MSLSKHKIIELRTIYLRNNHVSISIFPCACANQLSDVSTVEIESGVLV